MKPNMIKKWSIALLVAAGAAGLTGCEGMRVDEGASNATATNNGNIEDRAALKTNLSGVVVDDFGMPIQGMTVTAYGMKETTGPDGHWVMNDVPVTGVTVNSTPQNLEQTNLSTSGAIYVTYEMTGYATYHSRIDNAQAVVTHYGTAGGNPNSIVVSNLIASDRVKIPALSNSLTGILIDKGTLFDGVVGEYDTAPANVQVRLVPELMATDANAGWAQYGGSSCQTECGFFGLPEYVTRTDANGAFTFDNVAKLNGGYVLRVDNYGYRASERPNDMAGFSYNYDANAAAGAAGNIYGGNFTPLSVQEGEWEITDETLGISFDARGSNSIDNLINLGPLFVQDYLVANLNTVEGISVGDKTYNPNDMQGYGAANTNDGHNPTIIGQLALQTDGGVIIDSGIVSGLGTDAPLRFIFSGDMRELANLSDYPNGVVVFDGAGSRVSVDTDKTKLAGRVLHVYTDSALTSGKTYFVRLHRDVFIDMDAKRLLTEEELSALGNPEYDPSSALDETISMTDDDLYAEYFISYITPDLETTALSLSQKHITDADRQQISATGSALSVLDSTWKYTELSVGDDGNEDDRLDILYNAIRDRYPDDIYDNDDDVAVRTDVATVTFDVTANKYYRLRVYDPNPSANTITAVTVVSTTDTGGGNIAATEDNVINEPAEVAIDNEGNAFATITFKAENTGSAVVDLTDVGIGYKVAVVKANDFADFVAYDEAMTIELKDDLAPLVALQHSDRSGQDHTTYNNNFAPHDSIGMLIEFGELTTDEAGEPINGDTKIYYPKLNLTASLYDECHKRAKSENVDANYDDALEPQNQTQLDTYYNATPLLATSKTFGSNDDGKCATLSAVGTTCATGRSDNIYTADDYTCWYGGTDSIADSCKFYAVDPGDQFAFYEVPEAGGATIDSTSTAAATADISTTLINNGQFELYTFATANTFVSGVNSQLTATAAVGYKGHPTLGPTGCLAIAGTPSDVVRNLVVDMTESVASIDNSDNTSALQAAYEASGNIAASSTLSDDSLGLLHLETPAQHSARSKVYHADTAGSTISSRSAHLIATIGDWRTITETGRYLTSAQDVDGNNDLLYRAEDFVIDSESDGADEKSILKLHGEKDGDNTDLSIAAGHASGVLFVDATPALATSFTVTDSTLTLEFDQPILDDANYPNNSYMDIYGDDFVYRLDIDAETMVRGTATDPETTDLNANAAAGSATINVGSAAFTNVANTLLAGTKISIVQTHNANAEGAHIVGDTILKLDGFDLAANDVIARGSIIAIGTGVSEERYLVVGQGGAAGANTEDDDASVVIGRDGTGEGYFVITPPLRTALGDNDAVRVIASSTHVTTADSATGGPAPVLNALPIYPDTQSTYLGAAAGDAAVVTILNPVVENSDSAYTDVFGLTTGDFNGGISVNAAITVSGSTMTIAVSDTTAAGLAGFNTFRPGGATSAGFALAAAEAIDMGGFFDDLSHNDAQSVLGRNEVDANGNAVVPAVEPDLRVDYQDVQDTNFNSWAKVENYDQYDNSGSPELVGTDELTCKLQQDATPRDGNTTNTFLYDVTSSAGITLVAAHGNAQTGVGAGDDADSIYTYDSTPAFPGANNEDDYPLFLFWGHNTSTSVTNAITPVRANLKLGGVTNIDTTNAQAYIYAPANAEIDENLLVTEANIESYIFALDNIFDSAGVALGQPGDAAGDDDATVTSSGAAAPTLSVGIPDYNGDAWDSTTDKLVIEDVLLDGVPYTLHFSIPQHTTADSAAATLVTTETNSSTLPTLTVYRKVQVSGPAFVADNDDDADNANLRAGNAVTTAFNPAISFDFREDLKDVTSSINYTIGSDPDAAAATPDDDRVTFTSTSAVKNATNANQVDVSFVFSTEGTTKYIGHGATFTVAATDYDDNQCSFTVTLNLGHGALASDDISGNATIDTNDGATDSDNNNVAEIVDPILNVISGNAVE